MTNNLTQLRTIVDNHCIELLSTTASTAIAVAITTDEHPLVVQAYGLQNRATQHEATIDTAFEIASISKSMASIATMQFVERGLLDVHAPLTTYLPTLATPAANDISLHRLLSHTAGLEDPEDPISDIHSIAALLDPTQTAFAYSNLGYDLVGFILEAVLGQSYAAIIDQQILQPLGMVHTTATNISPKTSTAIGYTFDGTDWQAIPFSPCQQASGCVVSTARDMATYARLFLNAGQPLLRRSSFETLMQPVVPAWGGFYGYGVVTSTVDGHRCVGHRGENDGFISYMLADLDAKIAAVALVSGTAEAIELGEFLLHTARAVGDN